MEYRIVEIEEGERKAEYTSDILRKLPAWFGIEESLQDYVDNVHKYPFWAAFENDHCIGFFSAVIHYNRTGEIYVCGIDSKYHRKGIGRLLYQRLEEYMVDNCCEYMLVKTISDTSPDKNYAKTRLFYKKMGFEELITLTEMWDENNPCLLMIKNIK
ncbi:MAG: GNAT family N-acetyltransferase [Streptococcaceae bacterium]|jgi:ribosomal protein S18 acetylase RimI-like enzyme|nr:GNAT family N-acetyltransferase [Streptococcaceae bacterium]